MLPLKPSFISSCNSFCACVWVSVFLTSTHFPRRFPASSYDSCFSQVEEARPLSHQNLLHLYCLFLLWTQEATIIIAIAIIDTINLCRLQLLRHAFLSLHFINKINKIKKKKGTLFSLWWSLWNLSLLGKPSILDWNDIRTVFTFWVGLQQFPKLTTKNGRKKD